MSRLDEAAAGGRNVLAFLDMIAHSEGTAGKGDGGYNVIVGGTYMDDHGTPEYFDDYADHPRRVIVLPRLGIKSSAAGRYQLLARYWDAYRKQLKLTDFSPENQDRVAIQQLKETRAYPLIQAGEFESAIGRCKNIWASLPGAGYGQRENKLDDLYAAYRAAGGELA